MKNAQANIIKRLVCVASLALLAGGCDDQLEPPQGELDIEVAAETDGADSVEEELAACGLDLAGEDAFTLVEGEEADDVLELDPYAPSIGDMTWDAEHGTQAPIGPGLEPGGIAECFNRIRCKHSWIGVLTCWYERCCLTDSGWKCIRTSP